MGLPGVCICAQQISIKCMLNRYIVVSFQWDIINYRLNYYTFALRRNQQSRQTNFYAFFTHRLPFFDAIPPRRVGDIPL